MKRSFFVLFFFSLFTCVYAQKNTRGLNDSLFRAFQAAAHARALKRQKQKLHFYAAVDKDTIKKVNLSGCDLTQLPDLSGFTRLQYLNLSYNLLKKVSVSDIKADSLKEIVLTHNHLRRLRFPQNLSITSVKLDENHFRRIPRSLKRLKNLKNLEIQHNRIKHIPRFLRKLDKLEEINLNFNHIKLTRGAVKNLSGINQILLAGNHIKQLPDNIDDLGAVQKLNFAKNELSSLPPSFEKLDSLRILIFYKNRFDTIPDVVFHLHRLIQLDFYYNNLHEIPSSIGQLRNLQQLFLSFNHISALPDSMRYLTGLRYVYIHHNDLKIIPVWIKNFTGLQRVGFGYNHLFSVPDLSGLKNLHEIDLQHNNLSVFPWKLAESPTVYILILRNNPFVLSQSEKERLDELVKKKRALGYTLIP